ncbi:MAG TPA: hypothetical protein VLA23_12125 [Candidatus Limnocylindrales bacterium]|nr:hypothetical protein [Candidatus Limnocylindrales bacterium]
MRGHDPERLHLAGRAAHLARLVDAGYGPGAAEEAMMEWETRADAEGRQHGTSAYWAGLDEWAVERRWTR